MKKQLGVRRILATVLAAAILLALLPVPASAQVSGATLYEYNNLAATANGTTAYADTYGPIWHSQSFFTGNVTHTASLIRLYAGRTGLPGIITLSLREANSTGGAYAVPTGGDIVQVNIDSDDFSAAQQSWHEFPIDEIELEDNTSYCIVLRAPYGDNANDIQWGSLAAGAVTDGAAGYSTDGGLTWTHDDPTDFLFEVWGEATLLVRQAAVFSSYLETDDMLFVAEYLNISPPYYDDYDSEQYFSLQVIHTDGTTLLANSPCRAWGNRPGSVYLSADNAASLQSGSAYYIRLKGNFGSEPYAQYQLAAADWKGTNLERLDGWALRTAESMEDYDDETYIVTVTGKGEVLDQTAGEIFDAGVPYLSAIRPNLFQVTLYTFEGYPFGDPDIGMGEGWEAVMGPEFAASMQEAGNIINFTAKDTAAALAIAVFMVAALVCAYVGSAGMGAVLAMPALAFAAWAGFFSPSAFAIIIIAFAFLFAYYFWWRPT